MEQLILHVGVQKTGTSLIQSSMRKLRPHLRDNAVAYIDRKAMLKIDDRMSWAAYGKGPEDRRSNFIADLRGIAKKERKRASGKATVVVSNETLIGTVAPEFGNPYWPKAEASVRDVIEALEPTRTKVLVYIRRQDRLMESQYMQRIHLGGTRKFAKFYEMVGGDDRINYLELIESIRRVPTVDEIVVTPFEIIGAGARRFVQDFLEKLDCGVDQLIKELPEVTQSNPSYTAPAYDVARKINRYLKTTAQVDEARAFLRKMFPVGEYPRAKLLSEKQRKNLIEMYRPVNEKLFAEYLPDYPVDSYGSPEATERLAAWLK